MNKIASILFPILGVVIGVIFIVSGIKTIADKDLYDTKVTATVADISEEWETSPDPEEPDRLVKTVYIDYEIDGKKFEHVTAPEQSDNMKVGDKVEILVQSKAPEKISAPDPAKGGIIFIVVGSLAVLVGGFMTVKKFLR